MAHAGIYATSAQITSLSGKYYDAGFTEAMINAACLRAEGIIHVAARKVFAVDITAYTAMPAGGKALLAEIEGCLVAMDAITYYMGTYSSSLEAQTMLSVYKDRVERGLKMLKEPDNVSFIVAGV